MPSPSLIALAILCILLLFLDALYRLGYRRGFRVAQQTEPPAPEMNLEIIDTFQSGRVYWRYGEGKTELTGYCDRTIFPAEAMETIAAHVTLKEQQRHADAADQLVDEFLATRGPFRLSTE